MKKLILPILILLLFLLIFFCIRCHSPKIEASLHSQVQTILTDNNLGTVYSVMNGRDLTLEGVVPSVDIKEKAGQLASTVWGVRTVRNLLNLEEIVRVEPEPTPVPEPVIEKPACLDEIAEMLTNEKIQFESGSSRITSKSHSLLNQIASALGSCENAEVEVSGHTDATGSNQLNQELSQRRAQAVASYLSNLSVDQERLSARGYGEEKPVSDNSTREGRAQNRRIEFNVREK